MVATVGLIGFRPHAEHVESVVCPPYDVIKPGSDLERLLSSRAESLFHVILGDDPTNALGQLKSKGALIGDDEPSYYVYQQSWSGGTRTGIFVAAEVTPYDEHQIIRHEKTFDHKVKGRIALRDATQHSFGPVFVLTRAPIEAVLADAKTQSDPVYDFRSDFDGHSDLHAIASRVWRVPEQCETGAAIKAALSEAPFYIADGHHRYHASLLNKQTHFLCYVTQDAGIQAYNRVINGTVKFSDIREQHEFAPVERFATPDKHSFCVYSGGRSYILRARDVPTDVVGRLDCSILERELYPSLGLSHDMISDLSHFDYYPESALDQMRAVVDDGTYDLAIALHPVSLDELMAVADAGLQDPDVVMPEKSTFFAPKILSGLVAYRHQQHRR